MDRPAFAVTVTSAALLDAQSGSDRVIPGGGIHVTGWTAKIDASSVGQVPVPSDVRLAQEDALHVTTGPA